MKKVFLALLIFCFTESYGFCATMNSYDSYGRKTGSYVTNGATTRSYDSYGRNTGTIKETSSGYNTYNNYGRKTSTVKKTSNGYAYDEYGRRTETYRTQSNGTTNIYDNTVAKQEVIKKIQTEELQNMTPMDEKLEVLDNIKVVTCKICN